MYPDQKVSAYRLRKLYRQNHITLKKIGTEVKLTPSQLRKQAQCKLKTFPFVIDIMEKQIGEICFIDEAVFTIGQTKAKTWMAKGQAIRVTKKRAGYTAVAAVAGIDS